MSRIQGAAGLDRRCGVRDRRAVGRYPFVAAVRHEPPGGRPHLGQAANLGLAGMQVRRRVHTAEPVLGPSSRLDVVFSLPDGEGLLRLAAEVVFDEPQGPVHHLTGLRFAQVPEEAARRLRRFLEPGG
ncbi:MAG: PilZ domain-containing protein [Myxococcales bacterium]|nr:PilZ domain-containing protein [Myxococcota bacterium]MDW8284380.1 PilZ domain-containing protein [Myxococcales bacterium]